MYGSWPEFVKYLAHDPGRSELLQGLLPREHARVVRHRARRVQLETNFSVVRILACVRILVVRRSLTEACVQAQRSMLKTLPSVEDVLKGAGEPTEPVEPVESTQQATEPTQPVEPTEAGAAATQAAFDTVADTVVEPVAEEAGGKEADKEADKEAGKEADKEVDKQADDEVDTAAVPAVDSDATVSDRGKHGHLVYGAFPQDIIKKVRGGSRACLHVWRGMNC